MSNVRNLIESFAFNESYIQNNYEDNVAENALDKMLLEMDTSYFKLPFSVKAVHLMRIGETYNIPYGDMVRFCEANRYDNFMEAIPVIAEHYDIKPESICVFIDEDSNSIDRTVERISDAIECSMKVFYHDSDYDDSEVSFMQIFGEDGKVIDDEDEDDVEAITEEDPDDDEIRKINKEGFSYTVGYVNVYNHDFDYYVEMSEVEKYMDYEGVESIKEAIWNIATENDIDWKKINILCESRSKTVKKKSRKGKATSRRSTRRKLKKFAKSDLRKKLKIGWLDTSKSSKGIK